MFFREGRPWQGPFRLYCGLGLPTRLGCPASPATASAKRAKTVFHRLLCALPRQNFAGPSMPTLVYIILLYCDGWLWAIAALSTSRHKLFRVRIFRGHLVGRFLGQNAALFPFPATPSSPVFCPIMLLVATLLALLASLGLPSTSVGFSVDISSNYCAAMKAYAPAPPLPPWVGGWVGRGDKVQKESNALWGSIG